ncbi:MAG: hypothetical protein Kow0077_15280 [Anaerolineae bacterium]
MSRNQHGTLFHITLFAALLFELFSVQVMALRHGGLVGMGGVLALAGLNGGLLSIAPHRRRAAIVGMIALAVISVTPALHLIDAQIRLRTATIARLHHPPRQTALSPLVQGYNLISMPAREADRALAAGRPPAP